MPQTCSKPLVDVAPVNNFFLFPSEQEGIYGVSFDDLPQTPRSRECSQTLCTDTKSSSCLDAMMNQFLLTPEHNTDIRMDSMMAGIFNKPDFIDFQLLTPIKHENMNAVSTEYPTNNESVSPNSLFSSEGYFPQSTSNWISATTSESSVQKAEITFSATSRDSSLSISASENTSISKVNEVNDLASNDISKVNFTPAIIRDRKMCNNQSIKAQQHQKFHWNKDHSKRMKKLYLKQTKGRTSNGKKPSCGQHRTQTQKPKWGNYLFPNPSISQKRFHKLKYDQIFEMFRKPRTLFTEDEEKNILLDEENVFFRFVTEPECSRFFQENLNRFTAEQLWYSFTHLQSDFLSICEDAFGNYVAQKYLQLGSNKLRKAILETLKTNIYPLSVDMYGCRVVQKFLECEWQKNKLLVAQELSGSIIKMVHDQHGNHVVQKMIQCLRPSDIGFVVDEIVEQTLSLAMHPNGSRVIQRLLQKLNRRKAQPLLREITPHSVILSKNQYGNYIIQWIIKNCVVERRMIVRNLVGRVAELSRDKFGSNVIEAAFRIPGQAHIRELAEELLVNVNASKGRYSQLALLGGDKFGNYVVQTLLESSSGTFRQRLFRALSQCCEIKRD